MKKFNLTEKQEAKILTAIFIISFAVYLDALFGVTLFKYVPLNEVFSSNRSHFTSYNLIPFSEMNGGILRDIILNTFLFIPFGFMIQMIPKRSKPWLPAVAIPFGVSLFIEALQYVLSLGAADTTDIISNTFGGIIGCILCIFFNIIFKKNIETSRKRLVCFIGIVAVIVFLLGK